jgi:glycosyltransferase involved in cell wall biosynthesis
MSLLEIKGNIHKAEISLCMIVKNEENNIANCLESVKDLVDEIIIVDTGSTDKTKEIVAQYTDKIYDFEWIDDFAAARNFAFSKGTKNYLMWLDADDIIKPANQKVFLDVKDFLSNNPDCDWATMLYQIAHDADGNPLYSYKRERIIKKNIFDSGAMQWIGSVHECIAVQGNGVHSEAIVTHTKNIAEHLTDRNLNILLNKAKSGKEMDTREYFYLGNELFDHQRHPEALDYYKIFFSKDNIFMEDGIAACIKACQSAVAVKDMKLAKEYAVKTFTFAPPRAEACCLMGDFLFGENNFKDAIFWYDMATKLTKPADSKGGFIEDCWTFIPHVQLCACYDRCGAPDRAFLHNEEALKYRPNHEGLLQNRVNLTKALADRGITVQHKVEQNPGESRQQRRARERAEKKTKVTN